MSPASARAIAEDRNKTMVEEMKRRCEVKTWFYMRCGIANASGLAQDTIPFEFRRERRREVALESNTNSSKRVYDAVLVHEGSALTGRRLIDGTVSDLFRKKSSKVHAP